MEELHNKNTSLLKDIIIGMSDGLSVPFALTGIIAAAAAFLLAKAVS